MSLIGISEALKALSLETNNIQLKNTCEHVAKLLETNSVPIQEVIKIFSEYILDLDVVCLFRKYLSNILLALVSAKIPTSPVFSNKQYDTCSEWEKKNHLVHAILLAALSDHPDILQYSLKYFEINPVSPYEVYISYIDCHNVAPKKRKVDDSIQKISDLHVVQCCYKLLTKLPNELSLKWDWSSFVSHFSGHNDTLITWMVKECMVILTNMTESQSKILAKKFNLNEDNTLEYVLPNDQQYNVTNVSIGEVDLNSANVINIDGIMLPINDKNNVQKGKLIPVKSTVNNLRSLALAVASGKAICLLGPVGSGKTALVEHLASITGRKGAVFKKVQLGDQTDSRMLLGSHQCTDVPGEFIWTPGVLTEAVQNGHWLLLEDIDSAALDVASTLSSLLERNSLCVPGYRDSLPVTPGFQLFVTQRTLVTNSGFQKKLSNSSALLQKHVTQINVEPLSRSELAEIIQVQFPSLSTITSRMIEVFMMFSVGSHDSSLQTTKTVITDKSKNVNIMKGSRLISTRDLMKWCFRSVVGYDVTSTESALKVLQDAIDIFCCSASSPEYRLELAKKVGLCLGIVETKSEFYCKHYKPNVSLNPTSLEVGRVKLSRKEKSLESIDFDNKQVVFSFTRQTACLLERIACCIASNEPVLLVGETGTGKTSSVQYIARQTGHKLVVINMNQQSDSADLLGGYKPVDLKYVIRPIRNEFEDLFKGFYNIEKNKKFLTHIDTCYETENWTALITLMKQSHKSAVSRLKSDEKEKILKKWISFGYKLSKLEQQIKAASKLTFAFIEGSLVKAMQEGSWVLLDEINLASAEILECLAGLLEDKNESIDLIEKGDKVPIKRHHDFTLFACMNPATDVGKKDLPVGLRNRFTEFFIDELTERNDLMLLIGDYLYHMNLSGVVLEAIYSFYAKIRKEAKLDLVDGSGNCPHYSLRTLCRALTAAAKARCGTVARSLYEAFCLSFLTQLDRSSHPKVEAMIAKAVLGKKSVKAVLSQLIPEPKVQGQNFLLFEGHWIPQGSLDITIPEGYILTPTVRKNLRDIARIISLGRLPILLQGDTSVGKTSLITYIAQASGNYCVRINNHQHTDLQEYIGSYATDASGKLVFREGVLVEAMRKGYWIILDELNLAPSEVLEALNRVLDDNRELFIPETQQVIKADPNFMLFATQNPPGLYGGRKMLSRAFRNRFVELHFDEIPRNELETILHQRCHVPPTYSKKMIEVMAELQVRRRGSAAVQGKDGFITLRDLFRWGNRYKHASKEVLTTDKFYDWDQHLADEGYLVLAGKVRQPEERTIIVQVIEKYIKRSVNPGNLFTLHQSTSPVTKHILETILNNQLREFSHVVWTFNMRRLAVLIAKSFTFDEPVLLVGETGCGKTTICQVLATLRNRQILAVNCHMHTESCDFLGGLRPVRQKKDDGRLFEWVDGPLVEAMEKGHMFLADEISLADDSVLERLNSLLEPERQIVLAERGMEDNAEIVMITADKNFHFIGTMNPGGDFGKKELSPALRNRFTEIWCDHVSSREDLLKVLEKSVHKGISLGNQEDGSSGIGNSILDFTGWLKNTEVTNKFPFNIRDLLTWVQFINATVTKGLLDTPEAYVHGACMTFLDCFGTALTGHIESTTLQIVRETAINFLLNQIETVGNEYTSTLRDMLSNKQKLFQAEIVDTKFGIKPFYIERGLSNATSEETFTFSAPTTGSNTLRLLRGLQLNKAILLEGNPGVGKTSLVTALAKASGHKVVRINLSDQTDITDLFGTDLPSEDGSFTFQEGAFLSALKNGDWILLDELNLAPQPVLEGLNACLDHRGEVYIPELGQTFKVKHQTRLFACQNPLKQGGARRGLPISFLNRFTQVYIDTLTKEDLLHIVETQYPKIPKDILHRIVNFNCKVSYEITEIFSWGHRGSPWEMNLRDIQRWCEALSKDQNEDKILSPGKFIDMLYINRMRTAEDKERMSQIYNEQFLPEYPKSSSHPQFDIDDKEILIGDVVLQKNVGNKNKVTCSSDTNLLVLRNQLPILKALMQCVKMNWLSILVGPSATGKSSVVQALADLTGNELQVVPVTSAMDVSDLLGGFEQVDYNRNLESIFDKIEKITMRTIRNIWLIQSNRQWKSNTLMSQIHEYKTLKSGIATEGSETGNFNEKTKFLLKHCEQLLKLDNSLEISKIISDLKKLQSKVAKATSVNAGGRFDWVDSLLVKTMIEGSWLLLDNVNLTSAAVLDRLNGLLEPNGVLSIPERGEVSEIKPHENFRIFFTVDPKYGEISRAMRNRGVEIFLLRSEDHNTNLSDIMSYMDLIGLISSTDLDPKYHDFSIDCHELMSSFIQGFDRPTVSHLLQATHLTSQQLIRGIPFKTAVLNSYSDVYIKPRCGNDFSSNVNVSLSEMKNNMLKALEDKIENFDITSDLLSIGTSHTLNIKDLCSNSALEIAKQTAFIVTNQSLSPEYILNYLFSVYTAYEKCSENSLFFFYNTIKRTLEKKCNELSNIAMKLNDIAYRYIAKEPIRKTDLHKRYHTESYELNKNEVSATNINSVLLYNATVKTYLELTISKDAFSTLEYSKAVLSGKLFDDFSEYPILKYCIKYIEMIDEYIVNSITNIDHLEDNLACRIFQLLNWRSRFLKVCALPIFVSSKKKRAAILKEEIVPFLYVHSKWVQKHLMSELFSLMQNNRDVLQKYEETLRLLTLEHNDDDAKLAKFSKKFRKLSGQPKLYENQYAYDLCLETTELLKRLTLDINLPIEKQLAKIAIEIPVDINLAIDVAENDSFHNIQKEVMKFMEAEKAVSSSQSNVGLVVKMLPINSYIILRLFKMLEKDLTQVINDIMVEKNTQINCITKSELTDIITYLVQVGKVTKSVPIALLNILNIFGKLHEADIIQRTSALPSKFLDEFYKFFVSSPSSYPIAFFNIHKPNQEVTEAVPTSYKRLSDNLPLMPYYVQKLTVNTGNGASRHLLAYETVSLNDRAEYSILLENLLGTLWKNIATLDTAAVVKLKLDAKTEMAKYTQLLALLTKIIVPDAINECDIISSVEPELYWEKFKEEMKFHYDMLSEVRKVYNKLSHTLGSKKFDKIKVEILTAKLSLLVNILSLKVISELSSVDHVEKYRLKVQYIEEDVKMFETLLSSYYMHGVISGAIPENDKILQASDLTGKPLKITEHINDLKMVHPYCEHVMALKRSTAEKIHKYASGNTFRPDQPSYNNFAKECKHFTKSVLAPKTVTDICKNLLTICDVIHKNLSQNIMNKGTIHNAQLVVKETSSWLFSVNSFYNKVETTYSEAFPDLAKPLQSSLSQIVYSVTNLKEVVVKLIAKIEQGPLLRSVVTDLVAYPNKIQYRNEEYLNRFLSDGFVELLKRNINVTSEDTFNSDLECLEVLKMNLSELRMYCTAKKCVDKPVFGSVLDTLDLLVKAWENQQKDIEKKKQDDEALYVTKSKCEDEDEEADNLQEIKEMFPSFSETDFAEFKPPSLEATPAKKKDHIDHPKPKHLMSGEDVSLIYKWHSSFVRDFTAAEWLPSPKKLVGSDVISPLVLRYPIFSRVIENAWEALDAEFEGQISPSLLVLVSHIKENVDGYESNGHKVDFYHSSWVSETRQCVPLLYKVKDNTNELLDQWPDFPTLKDIIVIVNRILNFPMTSPVSRFLTGVELLRDKIEEWNKNAHKGNNMIDISLEVGQQIINWRKLEMGHWKEILNNLYYRKQSEAHKYWFYLYSVICQYLSNESDNEESLSPSRVTTVLKDFMEKANLAEYEVRLDIIYVFHCHLVHLERSDRRDELLSILWNTYNYYAQFSAQIASLLKEKRAPIEKKLRDFIKICSWDRDLSYWSVKDTVEKAHKALHKHTKEFEKVLSESVITCLVDKSTDVTVDHVGIWDRPKRSTGPNVPNGGAYLIDTQNHIVLARNIKKYLDQAEKPSTLLDESSLLCKVPTLLNKAKTLCKDTITNTGYPSLVQVLDDFVTLIIETSSHLGSLEVEATAPKEKQTSQAKNIVQQKRKALADLFKYLSKMGLNYRTGLVILSAANDDLYDFTIPPIDLDAAMSYLKNRRCDASLSLLWSGCEKYFQKNIARHRLLSATLTSPHQDLGMQNIERCKGFAAQLLKLTNSQKKSISKYSRYLCDLRTLTTNISNALDIDSEINNIATLNQKLNILTGCYSNMSVILDQFSIVLKSIPEKTLNADIQPEFDSILSNSPIVKCYKDSEEWKILYQKVKSIITIVEKENNTLHKLKIVIPKEISPNNANIPVISQNHIDVTNEAIDNLSNLKGIMYDLLQEYQFRFKSLELEDYTTQHPVLKTIVDLLKFVDDTINDIEALDKHVDEEMNESLSDTKNSIISQTEDVIATMLLVIQSVYKKHLPQDKTAENVDLFEAIDEIVDENKEREEESQEILEDKHLKELLQEKLSMDVKTLQLDALVNKISSLFTNYVQFMVTKPNDIDEMKDVMMRLVPILEQTVLFIQFFVTQKVAVHRVSCKMLSVLLKIFSDLATKGFCKPSDLDMEEGEGEGGPGKLSGGMGLGEGEGQKDVSERIENQDQLDDAQRPGEEKKDEDRDCKEEEKGINMTDDFESHLQDVEKKEGENSEEEDDDNEDADKQMGETDNAAEKLDQQIWGSEDEEDIEDQKDKKEEKGKGESTGEKEIGAKEEEQGTDDGSEGKEKKKKEINEMQEPEVDDDHIDPYHGNHQPQPEPEDFDLPDDMDMDGEEGDDKEGETETENPFEIDVMKEVPEEKEDETNDEAKEENRQGLDVSSDEEDGEQDADKNKNEEDTQAENEDIPKDENEKSDPDQAGEENDTEDKGNIQEDAPEDPEEKNSDDQNPEENLPKNPDDVNKEDEIEQDKTEANPEANPSNNDPTAEDKVENAEMDRGTNDNVDTNAEQAKDEDTAPYEQAQEDVGEDKQSTGRSELDKSDKGHRGEKQATSKAQQGQKEQQKYENKPGQTDQERTLGDINEKKNKKLHTLDNQKDDGTEEGPEDGKDEERDADAYQHVKQARKDDLQAVDAATKEQADQQPTVQQEDEEGTKMEEDDEIPMEVDDDLEVEKAEELKPEKIKDGADKDKEKAGKKKEGAEEPTGETGIEIEGENVVTAAVSRGNESTYHTRLEELGSTETEDLTLEQYTNLQAFISGTARGGEAGAWRAVWQRSASAARSLADTLRLVLEPTGRARKAGDFRTGRAINMRRVIPYIASHFRKDRIWMRRTKPAKREYKIAIAVDDSSSMSDNRSKELAFESLALVSQALNILEAGDLAVLSFGEKPNLLHPFTEQFSEHSGAKILQELTFEQTKTKIAQLLDFTTVMFDQQAVNSDAVNAKLLVIVSDGRGIFSEGETRVIQAVRRARQQGIFLVYIIVDNPDNKDSIMDIRRPLMDPVKNSVYFVPYLDTFPFPFYLILRDISALPYVLGDALRQWFELAVNIAN